MSPEYLLAVDQGTSATKAIIFDEQGRPVTRATQEIESSYPRPGFVEQDPEEIYRSVLKSVKKCLKTFREEHGGTVKDILACGISNQRETFLLWDEKGRPVTNAVVWQCKRSVEICSRLQGSDLEEEIKARTGLIADPYFSGTKLIWLYENDPVVNKAIDEGKAYFGTVDTWLLYRLTKGRRYFTDYTNASRTLLFNIETLQWDDYLLREYHFNRLNLPDPNPSAFDYGATDFEGILPFEVPIAAIIGDSHAAAFGEGCFHPGDAKATLGTGSSILLNTGEKRIPSRHGMVTTICWSTGDRLDYALEGVIVTCGATITWLRDQLGLFADSNETESMARAVESNNGVYLIPAFSGLGAPHWKMEMKGMLVGLTLGTHKNHVVRAALESIPFQIKDVIAAMENDSGIPLQELKVDGGITANTFVMQFLADALNTGVVNIGIPDVSALGAGYLAGLQAGVFKDMDHLQSLPREAHTYQPGAKAASVLSAYRGWQQILEQQLGR